MSLAHGAVFYAEMLSSIKQYLRQHHIDDFPIKQSLALHLYSERIAFDLSANGEAINTAIAQIWLITIGTLSCLLL